MYSIMSLSCWRIALFVIVSARVYIILCVWFICMRVIRLNLFVMAFAWCRMCVCVCVFRSVTNTDTNTHEITLFRSLGMRFIYLWHTLNEHMWTFTKWTSSYYVHDYVLYIFYPYSVGVRVCVYVSFIHIHSVGCCNFNDELCTGIGKWILSCDSK